ncbi:MAG: carboxylesterase family protein, partial [Myxococcales bacterium]|nr:carboxylesterase family protein [Myxococcales bacterium]
MDKSLIVETSAGKVAGTEVDGVRQWLGVPYAHAERFAAPGPAEPWKGVRAAKRFAPQCPQIFGSNPKRAQVGERFTERGCLALNIWAPASDPEPGRLRPVFFWIHGGAFCAGGSNIYRGAELARSGDIIVVGINYRLGVLGFVDFGGALDEPEIPSNLGLRDQIAALEWVRDNIAGFGGDPRKVTIAGESAGSISVSLLMVCRRAWPLFRGAIMQSGALTLIRGQDKAQELARSYLGLLGLGRREGLAGLRRLDVRTLLEAQAGIDGRQSANVPAVPWFDGDLLPASLDEALEHPHAEVPLIAGATREEVRLFEV